MKSMQLQLEKFHMFSVASLLKADVTKKQVYFGGIQQETMQDILNVLGFEKGDLPFKYLGVRLYIFQKTYSNAM